MLRNTRNGHPWLSPETSSCPPTYWRERGMTRRVGRLETEAQYPVQACMAQQQHPDQREDRDTEQGPQDIRSQGRRFVMKQRVFIIAAP
jgi:hypothetical protein